MSSLLTPSSSYRPTSPSTAAPHLTLHIHMLHMPHMLHMQHTHMLHLTLRPTLRPTHSALSVVQDTPPNEMYRLAA